MKVKQIEKIANLKSGNRKFENKLIFYILIYILTSENHYFYMQNYYLQCNINTLKSELFS